MKLKQLSLNGDKWEEELSLIDISPNVFILFVSPLFTKIKDVVSELALKFPEAHIIGCSTAGEISDVNVKDSTVSLTAIQLEHTKCKLITVPVDSMHHSYNAGSHLAQQLLEDNLKHVFVLSDGLNVNGGDLVSGFKNVMPNVSITGGLAADGPDFKNTFIIANGKIKNKLVLGLGFYGDRLKVGFSSKGGWDSFGVERLVTKSKKNILYELDGMPALELYKSYLGANADNLPSSALLFPLSMRSNDYDAPLVRTILGINVKDQSLTFAGNIPEGSYVRLMKANVDRLIDGAKDSGTNAFLATNNNAQLAILISCFGRRLVLKQLVEEEVEVVKEVVNTNTIITGFYSYGEIAPFGEFSSSELHNQTMTVTTFCEC